MAMHPATTSPRAHWLQILSTIASSAIGSVAMVIGTALLVRHLGSEDFGRMALLTSAAMTLGSVTSSGVALYIVRACAQAPDERERTLQLRTGTLFGQGLALAISLSLLCYGLLLQPQRWGDFLLTGLALHFTTGDSLSKSRLIGHQLVFPLSMATVVGTLASVAIQLAGAWWKGAPGYLAGFCLGTGLQALVSYGTCHRFLPSTGGPWTAAVQHVRSRTFLQFVLLATLSASLVPLAHWLSSVIAAQKAQRYSDVAVLAVAMQMFNIVLFVPTVLNRILLPRTIQQDAQRSLQESHREAYRLSGIMLLVAVPAPLLLWLFSDQVAALYRFASGDAIRAVYCFVLGSVIACAAIPIANHLVSQARMGQGLLANCVWSIIYVGVAFLLPGGAIAVGYGLLLAYSASLCLSLFLLTLHGRHTQKLAP